MMAAFEKGEKLRFIGHLDLMRTMQRALRRSHLPIKYSNGFNPHIRLSFAAPLSVGVAGKREMMEVPVEDGTSPAEFIQKLNACLPPDLQIVSAKPVSDEFPTLMSLMAGSEYSVRLPRSAAAAKPAPNSMPFTAGIPNIMEAIFPSIPSNRGPPSPTGRPSTAHSMMPPTESPSALAAAMAARMASPAASSTTGKGFSAVEAVSGAVSVTPPMAAIRLITVMPCRRRS